MTKTPKIYGAEYFDELFNKKQGYVVGETTIIPLD